MYVSIETGLTIHEWAAIMGISPWEIAQVGAGLNDSHQKQCAHVFFQYSWQQDYLSREEIAFRIAEAEMMFAREANFWPSPRYIEGETRLYPRPLQRNLYGGGGDARGQWKTVQLDYGLVQRAGKRARSLISAGVAVVTSDTDADGVHDKFVVTFATSVTDPSEIGLYFVAADRLNEPIDERYRIRPVSVTISGGSATVTGHITTIVKPVLTFPNNAAVLNATVLANYAVTLDAYRVYTDTTYSTANPAQGTAEWEVLNCASPPCAVEWVPVCIGERNGRSGQVRADWLLSGTQLPPQFREPDRLQVNYLSGVALTNGRMAMEFADVIAHLATGLLPVGSCGCERSDRIVSHWRNLPGDSENERMLSQKEIDENTFGQTRGALYAWNRTKYLKQVWSVMV